MSDPLCRICHSLAYVFGRFNDRGFCCAHGRSFCVEKGLSHNKFYLCLYFYNLWQSNTYYCVYCVQIALCAWFAGLERACIERRSKCSVFIARKSARMLQCSIKNYININGELYCARLKWAGQGRLERSSTIHRDFWYILGKVQARLIVLG